MQAVPIEQDSDHHQFYINMEVSPSSARGFSQPAGLHHLSCQRVTRLLRKGDEAEGYRVYVHKLF